jgi:hypothetical protein
VSARVVSTARPRGTDRAATRTEGERAGMYIGVGTVVLVLIIVLIIYLARRV